ncbi:hypothetical protein [Paenibacillus xylanexedens]|uniref:hypothetical protein n=1 Tax=Paenibacillus xylanexedens TaxID=528191 RepID=UPI001642A87F|nr:hypothetical protein [Paenibacillus xylanexedens]
MFLLVFTDDSYNVPVFTTLGVCQVCPAASASLKCFCRIEGVCPMREYIVISFQDNL